MTDIEKETWRVWYDKTPIGFTMARFDLTQIPWFQYRVDLASEGITVRGWHLRMHLKKLTFDLSQGNDLLGVCRTIPGYITQLYFSKQEVELPKEVHSRISRNLSSMLGYALMHQVRDLTNEQAQARFVEERGTLALMGLSPMPGR